jgi:hypothetical protein
MLSRFGLFDYFEIVQGTALGQVFHFVISSHLGFENWLVRALPDPAPPVDGPGQYLLDGNEISEIVGSDLNPAARTEAAVQIQEKLPVQQPVLMILRFGPGVRVVNVKYIDAVGLNMIADHPSGIHSNKSDVEKPLFLGPANPDLHIAQDLIDAQKVNARLVPGPSDQGGGFATADLHLDRIAVPENFRKDERVRGVIGKFEEP